MADVSKAVSDRMAITRTLTSALEVHGAEVATALDAALFPEGAPANCDVRVLLLALQGYAQRALDEVVAKDQAHAVELADDGEPRQAREASRGALRECMIGIRSTLEGVYGGRILGAYGLTGETPIDADALVHSASTTEDLLRNRPLTEQPLRLGVTVDAIALANELHGRIGALRTALGDVRREEREAQVTREARNASLLKWNWTYQGLADVTTGLFEVAGHAALADRVRPTARRRAGMTEEADTEENGTETK